MFGYTAMVTLCQNFYIFNGKAKKIKINFLFILVFLRYNSFYLNSPSLYIVIFPYIGFFNITITAIPFALGKFNDHWYIFNFFFLPYFHFSVIS